MTSARTLVLLEHLPGYRDLEECLDPIQRWIEAASPTIVFVLGDDAIYPYPSDLDARQVAFGTLEQLESLLSHGNIDLVLLWQGCLETLDVIERMQPACRVLVWMRACERFLRSKRPSRLVAGWPAPVGEVSTWANRGGEFRLAHSLLVSRALDITIVAPTEFSLHEILALEGSTNTAKVIVAPPYIDEERFPFVERTRRVRKSLLYMVGRGYISDAGEHLDFLNALLALPYCSYLDLTVLYDSSEPDLVISSPPGVVVSKCGYVNVNDALVGRLVAQADILVTPSEFTAHLPVTLAGMLAGVVPIVCDAPGVREFIEDGRSGFIVPENSSGALIRAVERLFYNPELLLRLSMGAAGAIRRRQATQASLETVIRAAIGDRRDFSKEQSSSGNRAAELDFGGSSTDLAVGVYRPNLGKANATRSGSESWLLEAPATIRDITIDIEAGILVSTIVADGLDLVYAFYLYRNDELAERTPYKRSNTVRWRVEPDALYRVRGFARSGDLVGETSTRSSAPVLA